MLFVPYIAALFAISVAVAQAPNTITVVTPGSAVQCQPTLLQWGGGKAPYFVTINVGGSVSQTLETILSGTTETSYTWNVDLPAGTSFTLAIKDANGDQNYSAPVSVGRNPSGITNCLASSQPSQAAAAESTTAAASANTAASSSSLATTNTPTTTTAPVSSGFSTSRTSAAASSAAAGTNSVSRALSSVVAAASSAAAAPASAGHLTYGTSLVALVGAGAVALFAL